MAYLVCLTAYELHCLSHEEDNVLLCNEFGVAQKVDAEGDVEHRQAADAAVVGDRA